LTAFAPFPAEQETGGPVCEIWAMASAIPQPITINPRDWIKFADDVSDCRR
jgi:hypothetical protein